MAKYLPVEELDVYRLAERLSDAVWDVAIQWKPFERDTVGKQLVRAADSIGANIAEGASDGSPVENKRFVRYARRSLCETRFFLRRAHARRLVSDGQIAVIKPLLDELGPRLQAYYKALCRRCSAQHDHTTTQQHHKEARP
jgi:four helix bundle protein